MRGKIASQVHVTGRVQGVGFRWYARERAETLGVAGWVRNLHDGRVEAWIEGPAGAVEEMLGWLRSGPPSARVDAVDAREREPSGAGGFEVRSTAF
ncbi:MAG: acylphosphatase [Planctomycetota bacterium]